MALSFLYIGFVRLAQLTRLCRRGQEELAIEIVVLRHESWCYVARSSGQPCRRQTERYWRA